MTDMPPERYRGERADLHGRIPFCAKHILVLGEDLIGLAHLLQRRIDTTVYGVSPSPELGSVLGERAFTALAGLVASPPDKQFDCAVFLDPDLGDNSFADALEELKPLLGPYGQVYVLTKNPEYWNCDPVEALSPLPIVGEAAKCVDFHTYSVDTVDDEEFLNVATSSGGAPFLYENRSFGESAPEERAAWAASDFLLVFVRPDYNPIEHAHTLLEANDPGGSYEVLERIPSAYLEDSTTHAVINTEMLICLARWHEHNQNQDRIEMLVRAQELFYPAVFREPRFVPAYRCQAELWRQAGDSDMARRLLRSILHVAPDADAAAQLEVLQDDVPGESSIEEPPVWQQETGPKRFLYIMNERPHYGLDVLYDGLCRILGDSAVVEYPYKPTLHGAQPEEHKLYPCNFDWPGNPQDIDATISQLRGGEFDAVLWGDCERGVPQEDATAIAEAAGDTPVFLIDQIDEFLDIRARVESRIGRAVQGYFKREMLVCADYGPHAYPLPFAYPDGRVPESIAGSRSDDVFWAGHRQFGLRQLYLEHLESTFSLDLSEMFDQERYAARLRTSRIGLNFFGFGFDTVRYWELPAHGALLFAERLPIHIPNDFVDGETAVFFDALSDLEEKLRALLDDPDRVERIAAAGAAHLRAHHTGSARATQLLGWIQNLA